MGGTVPSNVVVEAVDVTKKGSVGHQYQGAFHTMPTTRYTYTVERKVASFCKCF